MPIDKAGNLMLMLIQQFMITKLFSSNLSLSEMYK